MFISPTAVCFIRLATDLHTGLICIDRPFTARIMARTAGLIAPTMVANGLTVGIVRVDTVTAVANLALRQNLRTKSLNIKPILLTAPVAR
ncbi:hypothetical protein KUF54_09305 [Comamonas sp. Y33R10-2]|uniref:hypothetical protein n=1 Tax=Comamonas sp. Y33R10-2 TaxID=2853257 RepID=UPI001C5CA204|nr:hypothetical protein [Comamonas sp. Y33R10-2]QXZ08313.1 hypothetical protein KUF54_09305 [Comamonas sp. Y33R10-2]